MKQMTINTRYVGAILIILSIALSLIMYNFLSTMLGMIDSGQVSGSCSAYETCPHIAVLNQAYVGYGLSAIIFAIGVFLIVYGGKPEKPEGGKTNWDKVLKTLAGDEKLVYQKIADAGGVMFQSELVEQSGFPKAKVSRILDRLEAGRMVERKRRGMANAIVLK